MSGETRAVVPDEYRQTADGAEQPWGCFAPGLLQRILIGFARNTPLRRGLFRRTMTRLIMGLSGNPLDVMFRGCAYRLYGHNNLIEYGILLSPNYNAADIDFLLEGAAEGDNFVDVGSNIGLYSLPMAKRAGSSGKVISIDANPLMVSRLRRNAAWSSLSNLTFFSCGVSDTDGAATLTIRKDDVAIVALEESDDGDIPIRTLGSVIDEAGVETIFGLKIDIEGHEDKALVPFLDNAPRSMLPRRIVIEHPQPDADYPGCTEAFARHGYDLVGRTRNNSLYLLSRSGM